MRPDMRFIWVAAAAALVLAMVACAPAAVPTPTPTKAPAAATPAAAAPTKAAEPAKPAAATPTTPPKALDPIKIGAVNSFSGYAAAVGQGERDAIMAVEEKVNKEGGINGRQIKVIYYDDESDESKAVLATKKLIEQDRVLAIVGSGYTGLNMAEGPVAEEGKTVLMAMGSSHNIVVGKKWVFKLNSREESMMESGFKIEKGLGIKKLGWLNVAAGNGRENRKYVEANAPAKGITLVALEEYGANDTDMKPQLTRIKAAAPDGLFIFGAEAAGILAIGQAKQLGLNVPIVTPSGFTTPGLMAVKELRDTVEGIYTVGHKVAVWEQLPDSDPRKKINADLAALMKAKYNRPLADFEGLGYDGITLILNAVKAANPDPSKVEEARSKIRDALESGTKNYIGASTIIDAYTPDEHEGSGNPDIFTALLVGKDGKMTFAKLPFAQ